MFDLLRLCFGLLVRLFRSRESLLVENLALRQQLAVFKRKRSRPNWQPWTSCSGLGSGASGLRGTTP